MTGPSPDFYLKIYSCTHRVGCVSSCWMRLGGLGILSDLKPHYVKVPPRAWLRGVLIPWLTSPLLSDCQTGILLNTDCYYIK